MRVFSREEIESLVDFAEAIDLLEQVFRYHGKGQASNLTQNFRLNENSLVSIKAGYLPSIQRVGLKTLGLVVLCEESKLRNPLAVFEQSYITFVRTGAAGAVAAKLLAKPQSRVAAILGTGLQGRAQLLALSKVFALEEVRAWSPTTSKREQFAKEMKTKLGIEVIPTSTAQEAVQSADIIVTATRAKSPFLESEWVEDGAHITAVGSDMPGAQELSDTLLKRGRIFADDKDQAMWMGASNSPLSREVLTKDDILGSLGQVLTGSLKGRTTEHDITIFDCSGLGMMDLILADYLYRKATN